eukprot:IDg4432t1
MRLYLIITVPLQNVLPGYCTYSQLSFNHSSAADPIYARKSNDSRDLFLLATTIRDGLPATTRPRISLVVPNLTRTPSPLVNFKAYVVPTITLVRIANQSRLLEVKTCVGNNLPFVLEQLHLAASTNCSPTVGFAKVRAGSRCAAPSVRAFLGTSAEVGVTLEGEFTVLALRLRHFDPRYSVLPTTSAILPARLLAIMASKRGGRSSLPQVKRVLFSAGDQPNTEKPPTVSSEFAGISRRAHEQVLQENVATIQQWFAATGAEHAPLHETEAPPTPMGTQIRPEELAHITPPFPVPFVPPRRDAGGRLIPAFVRRSLTCPPKNTPGSDNPTFTVALQQPRPKEQPPKGKGRRSPKKKNARNNFKPNSSGRSSRITTDQSDGHPSSSYADLARGSASVRTVDVAQEMRARRDLQDQCWNSLSNSLTELLSSRKMELEPLTMAQVPAMSAAALTQSLAQAMQVLQSAGLQTPEPLQLSKQSGLTRVKQEMSTPEQLLPGRKIHMSGCQFCALEPTLVYEFFDRFYLGFLRANVGEKEAFAMIQEFLICKERALYQSVVLSNRTNTGMVGYCTAINWLLRTFATDENFNKAGSTRLSKHNLSARADGHAEPECDPSSLRSVGKRLRARVPLNKIDPLYNCPVNASKREAYRKFPSFSLFPFMSLLSTTSLLFRVNCLLLDTGAGRNFIRLSSVSTEWLGNLQQDPVPDIRDANKRPIQVVGAITLCLQLGTRDGSSEPIVRRPLRHPPTVQTPKSTEPELRIPQVSTRVRVAKGTTVRPGEQTWAFLSTSSNFSRREFYLNRNIPISVLTPTASPLLYRNLAVGDLLQTNEYANRQDEWPDEDDLLAADFPKFKDLRPPPKEKVKKEDVSSVEELNLDHIPEEFRESLKGVLRPHESMWCGSLGQINAAEQRIELKPERVPYDNIRTGLVRELEK